MNHKEQYLKDIRERYPAYVTQAEFARIAGICKKTAYKLNRSGFVPYREVRTGFRHHYEIRTEDVIVYLASHMPEVRAFKCRNVYRVTKEDLIEYLSSPYYRFAHRKSTEWYRIERHVLAYEASELKLKTKTQL